MMVFIPQNQCLRHDACLDENQKHNDREKPLGHPACLYIISLVSVFRDGFATMLSGFLPYWPSSSDRLLHPATA